MGDIEIDQETDSLAAQSQIREQLRLVNGQDRFDGLDFNDHCVFNEDVDPITEVDRDAIVFKGARLFGFVRESMASQLVTQADAIRPLQQPWPESGMHLIRGAQNAVGNPPVNKGMAVSFVRVRDLSVCAFGKQLASQS